MLAASGVRSAFGVFIKPMEAEFAWDRPALSTVAALVLRLLTARAIGVDTVPALALRVSYVGELGWEPGAVVVGKRPILEGERSLGYVTSADYGYTVGRGIAYGYLPLSRAVPGTRLDIAYFERRCPATMCAEPLYDPKGLRLRA